MEIEKKMREWLLDCFDDEYDQEKINGLTIKELYKYIHCYFDGGVKTFIKCIEKQQVTI